MRIKRERESGGLGIPIFDVLFIWPHILAIAQAFRAYCLLNVTMQIHVTSPIFFSSTTQYLGLRKAIIQRHAITL
jgi:hypothetical protein